MRFFPLEHRTDRDLHLAIPSALLIDDYLSTCAHPQSWYEPQTLWTREQLLDFIQKYPAGHDRGDAVEGRSPSYYFWMQLRSEARPIIPIAGTIAFRPVQTDHVRNFSGHIGYGVYPAARGNHYAERACRLILPLARRHGMKELIITCNPDNIASRRTCERLGATLIDTLDIPPGNPLYEKGDRQKCRYRLST